MTTVSYQSSVPLRRVTISWGCAMQRKMTGQPRNSSRLLIPWQISSFVFAPDDRPDAVARCSPPGSGYSLNIATTRIYDCRKMKPEDSPTFKVSY
jgi:hypothetical protein